MDDYRACVGWRVFAAFPKYDLCDGEGGDKAWCGDVTCNAHTGYGEKDRQGLAIGEVPAHKALPAQGL